VTDGVALSSVTIGTGPVTAPSSPTLHDLRVPSLATAIIVVGMCVRGFPNVVTHRLAWLGPLIRQQHGNYYNMGAVVHHEEQGEGHAAPHLSR
jgi:hypothetical protein